MGVAPDKIGWPLDPLPGPPHVDAEHRFATTGRGSVAIGLAQLLVTKGLSDCDDLSIDQVELQRLLDATDDIAVIVASGLQAL